MQHLLLTEQDMVKDFKNRFRDCLPVTLPILALSPMIQQLTGIPASLPVRLELYLLIFLSSFVYFYGGIPFLRRAVNALKLIQPGMMALVSVAITTAYAYSSLVAFGLRGSIFFWNVAMLVDIMLLDHWLEMRSIIGASRALEDLARLMPCLGNGI